jgi:hypothetical protein
MRQASTTALPLVTSLTRLATVTSPNRPLSISLSWPKTSTLLFLSCLLAWPVLPLLRGHLLLLLHLHLLLLRLLLPGPYGKGYPRGMKTAAGCPPCGQATPQTAVRPFGGTQKNGMTEIRTHALKKIKGRLFWANHYTMAAIHLKMVECSIYT